MNEELGVDTSQQRSCGTPRKQFEYLSVSTAQSPAQVSDLTTNPTPLEVQSNAQQLNQSLSLTFSPIDEAPYRNMIDEENEEGYYGLGMEAVNAYTHS